MTDAASCPLTQSSPLRALAGSALVPLLLSVAAGGLCLWAAGASLGVLLGGMAVATLLLPPLALAEVRWERRVLAAAAVVDGIALVWLAAVFVHGSPITVGKWLGCYLVLIAYGTALLGVAWALGKLRLPAVFAAGVTVVLGLAWLSWPIWLSPYLLNHPHSALSGWLVGAHPLFAINGLFRGNVWLEYTRLYRLSVLMEDVPFSLPTLWPAVAAHAAIAVLTLGLATVLPSVDRSAAKA